MCNDGVEKVLGNKSLQLCIYHNQKRLRDKIPNIGKWDFLNPDKPAPEKKITNTVYCRAMWARHKKKECENCGKKLEKYNAKYISHILSRGAHNPMATDPLNHRLFCFECHHLYEFGTEGQRMGMKTWEDDQEIIQQLKEKYYHHNR